MALWVEGGTERLGNISTAGQLVRGGGSSCRGSQLQWIVVKGEVLGAPAWVQTTWGPGAGRPPRAEGAGGGALVSCSCSDKLPQTWWLKIEHIYHLPLWRSEVQNWVSWGLKSRCCIPSTSFREESVPCLSQFLEAAWMFWFTAASHLPLLLLSHLL